MTCSKRVCLLLVFALLAAACGSQQGSTNSGGEPTSGCDNTAQLVDLLASGSPTFDFDPSPDLETLVERSDLIIEGTLQSAVRVGIGDVQFESGTRIGAVADVLFGSNPAFESEFLASESFFVSSAWPDGAGDDPLGSLVDFESTDTRFVAFLFATGLTEAPFATLVEGLHVSCVPEDSLQPVAAPLPAPLAGTSDEIVRAVSDVVNQG